MEYIIENEFLKVTVTTAGAQIKSVVRKEDGVEHIWQADPQVWAYHTPILFPHTGKLKGGILTVDGQEYESKPHGFARISEHTLVSKGEDELVLELTDSEATRASWPFAFRLLSSFTLDGDTLHHTLTVENLDEKDMPFGIGFHPGFAIPFDGDHTFRDYELRFENPESPICLATDGGLISDKHYWLGSNMRAIEIDEHLFDNDSHCMTGLSSRTLGIYEKDTGRGVVCGIRNFPYVLIWSKPGEPKFICIEPWNSLPSPAAGGTDWYEKPAAAILAPGETWDTTLSTSFVR